MKLIHVCFYLCLIAYIRRLVKHSVCKAIRQILRLHIVIWICLLYTSRQSDAKRVMTEEELRTIVDVGQEDGIIEDEERDMTVSYTHLDVYKRQ